MEALTMLDALGSCLRKAVSGLAGCREASEQFNPAHKSAWLNLLETEAPDGLRDACAAGSQRRAAWYQAFGHDVADANTYARLARPVLGIGSHVSPTATCK